MRRDGSPHLRWQDESGRKVPIHGCYEEQAMGFVPSWSIWTWVLQPVSVALPMFIERHTDLYHQRCAKSATDSYCVANRLELTGNQFGEKQLSLPDFDNPEE